MKFHAQRVIRLMAALLVAASAPAGAALEVKSDPVEKASTVSEVEKSAERKPCIPSALHDGGHEKIWNLKKHSEFDFRKVGNLRYSVSRISSDVEKEIEDPVYVHVNFGRPWITLPPCKGKSLTDRQFLFAIEQLHEPGQPEFMSWHALIYVPVALDSGEHKFFLIVLNIENDSNKCTVMANEKRRKQCEALRTLAVMKMDNEPLKRIRETMAAKIDQILPPNGFGRDDSKLAPEEVEYHNGVIHGSLF